MSPEPTSATLSGPSAATLAAMLGADMPAAADIPDEAFALADAVRELVEATVVTDVDAAARSEAAELVARATELLRAAQRPKDAVVQLVRHDNGRFEHLTQAGSGRLNPQAARVEFLDLPTPPPAGAEPVPVEIRGRVTLRAQHGGPPGRVHGGVVATILDQLLGVAASASGPAGFTAGLDIRFRRATPYDVPLELSARFDRREGRKTFTTGEIRADGVVTAEATAVFVSDRTPGAGTGAHS
ncbi:PaaI family thioesterase [Yinghuangia seranimata]|uniref:PaaI family thioesterase n=1 Tax=Yinghuangia seranimata TaxID=408067 RepID=UPI00248A9BF9|nr:PaaI family thioesterase [Yinghuangia seranimata]MDI2131935.1 PaaI family thioesterase [Yinghuangia seranimata]